MAKFSVELTEKICSLLRTDSYTIAEVCEMLNIAESTFYEWKNTKPEFSEAIKKAEDDRKPFFAREAKKSLLKLIRGYDAEEKRTVSVDTGNKSDDGKPIVKIKEHTTTTKHIAPNPTAIIFTLTNCDPENWKNRLNAEHSGKGNTPLIPESIQLNIDALKPEDYALFMRRDGK